MSARPTKLQLTGDDRLRIEWNDATVREYGFRELRDSCPCATCREQRKQPQDSGNPLQVFSPAEVQPLQILGMEPVGNYAYKISFSDGHDTGIYEITTLRELGTVIASS